MVYARHNNYHEIVTIGKGTSIMKLFLIQHAQAKSKEEDPQRSLADEGKANIKKVAECVARTAPEITEVWHSEKLRTKQTAQILAKELDISDRLKEYPGLMPNDNVDSVNERLMEVKENVAIVGHLPFLDKLASLLLCHSQETRIINFAMGGIVCLNRDQENVWSIEWMITPGIVD